MARWVTISYGRGADRTGEIVQLVEAVRARGLALAGFYQNRSTDAEGHKAIELVRLSTGERTSLGASGPKRAEDGCSFVFGPEAFEAGLRWLQSDAPDCGLVLIDEVGKRELEGQGHLRALRWALSLPERYVLLVCTSGERLEKLVALLPAAEPVSHLELPPGPSEMSRFLEELSAAVE